MYNFQQNLQYYNIVPLCLYVFSYIHPVFKDIEIFINLGTKEISLWNKYMPITACMKSMEYLSIPSVRARLMLDADARHKPG